MVKTKPKKKSMLLIEKHSSSGITCQKFSSMYVKN